MPQTAVFKASRDDIRTDDIRGFVSYCDSRSRLTGRDRTASHVLALLVLASATEHGDGARKRRVAHEFMGLAAQQPDGEVVLCRGSRQIAVAVPEASALRE